MVKELEAEKKKLELSLDGFRRMEADLSRDYNVFLSLGEVDQAYAVLARIQSVKKSANLILQEIGRTEGKGNDKKV